VWTQLSFLQFLESLYHFVINCLNTRFQFLQVWLRGILNLILQKKNVWLQTWKSRAFNHFVDCAVVWVSPWSNQSSIVVWFSLLLATASEMLLISTVHLFSGWKICASFMSCNIWICVLSLWVGRLLSEAKGFLSDYNLLIQFTLS